MGARQESGCRFLLRGQNPKKAQHTDREREHRDQFAVPPACWTRVEATNIADPTLFRLPATLHKKLLSSRRNSIITRGLNAQLMLSSRRNREPKIYPAPGIPAINAQHMHRTILSTAPREWSVGAKNVAAGIQYIFRTCWEGQDAASLISRNVRNLLGMAHVRSAAVFQEPQTAGQSQGRGLLGINAPVAAPERNLFNGIERSKTKIKMSVRSN
jgi:hypothetical protein